MFKEWTGYGPVLNLPDKYLAPVKTGSRRSEFLFTDKKIYFQTFLLSIFYNKQFNFYVFHLQEVCLWLMCIN